MTEKSPLEDFKDQLMAFSSGERKGIRNPFIIVPVAPSLEHQAAMQLANWAKKISSPPENIKTRVIWLDKLLPQTKVFKLILKLGLGVTDNKSVEETLQNNLTNDLVTLITEKLEDDKREQILLLLNLGSLYPFAHASEILDELDRRNVKSTIGILFPGEIFAGKLSFFGKKARHYYPAHRIDKQIRGVHLQ